MVLALLIAGLACSGEAALPPTLAWPLEGIAVTATDSFKWVVRAAPDGAGGAVLAWEENRGRRVCCRDTRDLYAQRLDAAGARLWGPLDVKVAAEEAGEELLGIAAAGKGGALLFWRRGRGTLLAQELDGVGAPLDGPGGTVLHNGGDTCEWPQLTGFAVTPRNRRALLVWTEGELPRASSVMGVVSTLSEGRWLVTPPRTLLTRPGVHAGAVVACGEDRWCLLWWSTTGAGIEVGGQWLAADGSARGAPFLIGADPELQYGHVEGAAAGPDRVFVIWGAVHPEHAGHTHALHAAAVSARPGGRSAVAAAVLGQARSQVMFIPPTVVQVGSGEPLDATAPIAAWRQTSAVASTGAASAVVAWLDGQSLIAAGLRFGGAGLAVSATVSVGADANAGFSPLLVPCGGDAVLAAWAAQSGGRVRASGRVLRAGRDGLDVPAEPAVLAEGGTQLPRVACATSPERGGMVLAWNALGSGEHGAIVAQRVMLGAPSAVKAGSAAR